MPSGRKTYCIQYRNRNKIQKKLKLGIHGQITTEQARELAKKQLGLVANGKDLAEQKKKDLHLPTMTDLVRDYLEKHGVKKRAKSLYEDQKIIKGVIIPEFGNMKVDHVTKRDIEALHAQRKSTPYQANRILALLSKMFSLAESWGWVEKNPVLKVERYQEHKRDRWLSEEEVDRLLAVLNKHKDNISSYLFKILLLTGARKGKLLEATWDQFDLTGKVWHKPHSLTKQKREEHLPLSAEAITVLQELSEFTGKAEGYLFPGNMPNTHLKEVKRQWQNFIRQADIEGVRIHDLRHTHASHLVSSGLSLSIVGKLLGHSQTSTTQRYAHLADQALREATAVFGKKIKDKISTNSS